MKNEKYPNAVQALITLGLLVAAGSRADMIHPSLQNFQGEDFAFDFAWHQNGAPMAEKVGFAGERFDKAVQDWNAQGRSAYLKYHGGYLAPVSFPGGQPGFGENPEGNDVFAGNSGEGSFGQPGKDGHHDNQGRGNDGREPGGIECDLPASPPPAVPEPTSALLFAGGLLGIVVFARRRA